MTEVDSLSPEMREVVRLARIAEKVLRAQLVALEKKTAKGNVSAEDYYERGVLKRRLGRFGPLKEKLAYESEAVADFKQAHSLAGKNGDVRALIGTARVYLSRNEIDQAARYVSQAAAIDSNNIDVRTELTRINAFKSGNWKKAVNELEQLIKNAHGPESAPLWNAYASSLSKVGRFADAEAAYRKQAALDPSNITVWTNIAVTLADQGRIDKALAAYKAVLAVDRTNLYALNNSASLMVQSDNAKDLKIAIRMLTEVVELAPGFPAGWANLGNAYSDSGNCREAIRALRHAVELVPGYTVAWNNLGLAYSDCRQYALAVDAFSAAKRLKPDDPRILYHLGSAYGRAGNLSESIAVLRRATKLDATDPRVWNNLGTSLVKQEHYEEAAKAFREALRRDGNHVSSLENLGIVEMKLGRPERALEYQQRALAVAPRPGALETFVNASLRLGRSDEALKTVDRVLAATPQLASAHCDKATIYFHLRRLDKALQECDQALRLNKDFVRAFWQRGIIHLAADRYDNAEQDFRRSARDPNYAAYAIAFSWIARSRQRPSGEKISFPQWARFKDITDSWGKAIVSFQQGNIDSDTLLELATNEERKCEAYFHIGERTQHEHGRAAAKPWFRRCVATGIAEFYEFRFASWALEETAP